MVVKKKIFDYKMNDSTKIEIHYIGGGATAPDYLKVIKKDLVNNASTTVKILDELTNEYVFHINELNDSVIILNIIDTAQFTATNRNFEFRININQIDTTLNKYK